MSHPGFSCRDDERGRKSCPPLGEVGNFTRSGRDAGIPPVILASRPHSATPPVFPAKAGIHVASPVSVCLRIGVKTHRIAGCVWWREWASATSGVARRPELNLLSLRIGVWIPVRRKDDGEGEHGFRLSPEGRHLCKSNRWPVAKLRDDSCCYFQPSSALAEGKTMLFAVRTFVCDGTNVTVQTGLDLREGQA